MKQGRRNIPCYQSRKETDHDKTPPFTLQNNAEERVVRLAELSYGQIVKGNGCSMILIYNPNARHGGSLSEAYKQEILSFYTAGNTPSQIL